MKRALIATTVLLWCTAALALDIPPLTGRVNDNALLLTDQQQVQLSTNLKAYEESSGHQFVFLSVTSLDGRDIDEFANKTFHAWKLGDAKRDDGVLLVVSKTDRKIRIEVGYGLEGQIPDAVASRILRDITKPAFKREEWAAGTDATFDALMQAAASEGTAKPAAEAAPTTNAKLREQQIAVFGVVGLIFAVALCVGGFAAWHEERERKRRLAEVPVTRKVRSYPVPTPRPTPSPAAVSTPPSRAPSSAAMGHQTRTAVATHGFSYQDSSSRSSVSRDSASSSDSFSDSFSGGGGDSGGGGASSDF